MIGNQQAEDLRRACDALEAENRQLREALTEASSRALHDGAVAEAAMEQARRLHEAICRAYGYLWHVNNEPGTPNRHDAEAMAYQARKILRPLMTSGERGNAINAADAALQGESHERKN